MGFLLFLTLSSGALAADMAKTKMMSLTITLGVMPLTSSWDVGTEPQHAIRPDSFDGMITAAVLAVLCFPAVMIVAIGGLELLRRRLRARRSGSKPHNKS